MGPIKDQFNQGSFQLRMVEPRIHPTIYKLFKQLSNQVIQAYMGLVALNLAYCPAGTALQYIGIT